MCGCSIALKIAASATTPVTKGFVCLGEVQSSRSYLHQTVEQRRRAGEQRPAARKHQGTGNLVRPTSRLADD